MNLFKRSVLSYQSDTSDKVYILEVYTDPDKVPRSEGMLRATLMASWGRRTSARLNSQVKQQDVMLVRCESEYNKLRRSKLKSGYVEILEAELTAFSIPGYSKRLDAVSPIVRISNSINTIPKELVKADSALRTIL